MLNRNIWINTCWLELKIKAKKQIKNIFRFTKVLVKKGVKKKRN